MKDCNKLDSIDSLSKQIQSAAAILLRIDLLGDCDILKEFSAIFFEDQFDILNRLRCLRQWAATVPDLLNSDNLYYCVNQSRKSVFDSSKNFLDSLLLCLFSKDRITSYWDFVPVNVRSNVILSLSVCLQVIINLLSESTYSVELFDTNSLFTVLLSGSRPLILLTDHGMKLWLSDCHQLNHDRISSHYCYLVYLLLLRIQQTGSNIPEYILENIHHKIMRNKSVIWALVMEACQSSEESVPGKHLHFQLLLTQLATELVRHVIPPTNNVVINLEENFIKLYIDITGLALLLLCPDWADESLSQSQCEARKILPTSGKSCLGYWFSFLSLLHPSEMNCVMDILLMEFAALSLSWTKELIACSPENERWVNVAQNDSVSLLDRNYPCARLRGLVHILASISFSNLSTEKVVPSNESGCFRSEDLPCELQSPTSPKFSFITHQENEKLCESDKKMLITQDRADRLCKLLCNLLVTLHFATVKLEKFHSISDSVDSSLPLRSECSKENDFKLYVSRLAKKMILVPKTSVFSLLQAVCFKQDIIRCMVALITQYPHLSLSLVLHKFNFSEFSTDETLGNPVSSFSPSLSSTESFLSVFEVILDSTNRDPLNPFCVEWAILLIRLILNSNHSHSPQVKSLLSSTLNRLKVIPSENQSISSIPLLAISSLLIEDKVFICPSFGAMLYRKCFVLNISSKIISAYNRSICFQSNDLNKRLCHSVNLTESTLLSSTISHELLSTWINSKYIPNDLLQQEFSDVFAQNNLKNLLILCQDEVSVGRWRRIESSLSDKIYHHKNNSYSLLDSLFLDLYQMELTVDAITGVQMIGHVCRSKFGEQNLSMHNQNFDHLRIRLDILNPDLLLTKLYDPLVNIGVKHVNQLLERCPELPLSTMTCISPYPSNILSQKTILQEALEVLNHYLMHNDLVNVVQRFPSVLLRDRLELISLCEFCIHELHLESFDIIRALSSPNHKHSLRHSTGISICKCPVWELPLKDVRARFTLLRLAGCWPLSRPSVGKSINVDQKLASFLKASPAELSHCLNMNLRISTSKAKNSNNYDDKRSAPAKFDVSNGIVFTKSDIQFFEEVYSRLLTDTEDTVENVCHDVLTDDDHDDGSKESDLEI